jgi:hypothetical protein
MFPEPFKLYAVVSLPQMFSSGSSEIVCKIEQWEAHESTAKSAAEKLKTWKYATVIECEYKPSDVAMLLNDLNKERERKIREDSVPRL